MRVTLPAPFAAPSTPRPSGAPGSDDAQPLLDMPDPAPGAAFSDVLAGEEHLDRAGPEVGSSMAHGDAAEPDVPRQRAEEQGGTAGGASTVPVRDAPPGPPGSQHVDALHAQAGGAAISRARREYDPGGDEPRGDAAGRGTRVQERHHSAPEEDGSGAAALSMAMLQVMQAMPLVPAAVREPGDGAPDAVVTPAHGTGAGEFPVRSAADGPAPIALGGTALSGARLLPSHASPQLSAEDAGMPEGRARDASATGPPSQAAGDADRRGPPARAPGPAPADDRSERPQPADSAGDGVAGGWTPRPAAQAASFQPSIAVATPVRWLSMRPLAAGSERPPAPAAGTSTTSTLSWSGSGPVMQQFGAPAPDPQSNTGGVEINRYIAAIPPLTTGASARQDRGADVQWQPAIAAPAALEPQSASASDQQRSPRTADVPVPTNVAGRGGSQTQVRQPGRFAVPAQLLTARPADDRAQAAADSMTSTEAALPTVPARNEDQAISAPPPVEQMPATTARAPLAVPAPIVPWTAVRQETMSPSQAERGTVVNVEQRASGAQPDAGRVQAIPEQGMASPSHTYGASGPSGTPAPRDATSTDLAAERRPQPAPHTAAAAIPSRPIGQPAATAELQELPATQRLAGGQTVGERIIAPVAPAIPRADAAPLRATIDPRDQAIAQRSGTVPLAQPGESYSPARGDPAPHEDAQASGLAGPVAAARHPSMGADQAGRAVADRPLVQQPPAIATIASGPRHAPGSVSPLHAQPSIPFEPASQTSAPARTASPVAPVRLAQQPAPAQPPLAAAVALPAIGTGPVPVAGASVRAAAPAPIQHASQAEVRQADAPPSRIAPDAHAGAGQRVPSARPDAGQVQALLGEGMESPSPDDGGGSRHGTAAPYDAAPVAQVAARTPQPESGASAATLPRPSGRPSASVEAVERAAMQGTPGGQAMVAPRSVASPGRQIAGSVAPAASRADAEPRRVVPSEPAEETTSAHQPTGLATATGGSRARATLPAGPPLDEQPAGGAATIATAPRDGTDVAEPGGVSGDPPSPAAAPAMASPRRTSVPSSQVGVRQVMPQAPSSRLAPSGPRAATPARLADQVSGAQPPRQGRAEQLPTMATSLRDGEHLPVATWGMDANPIQPADTAPTALRRVAVPASRSEPSPRTEADRGEVGAAGNIFGPTTEIDGREPLHATQRAALPARGQFAPAPRPEGRWRSWTPAAPGQLRSGAGTSTRAESVTTAASAGASQDVSLVQPDGDRAQPRARQGAEQAFPGENGSVATDASAREAIPPAGVVTSPTQQPAHPAHVDGPDAQSAPTEHQMVRATAGANVPRRLPADATIARATEPRPGSTNQAGRGYPMAPDNAGASLPRAIDQRVAVAPAVQGATSRQVMAAGAAQPRQLAAPAQGAGSAGRAVSEPVAPRRGPDARRQDVQAAPGIRQDAGAPVQTTRPDARTLVAGPGSSPVAVQDAPYAQPAPVHAQAQPHQTAGSIVSGQIALAAPVPAAVTSIGTVRPPVAAMQDDARSAFRPHAGTIDRAAAVGDHAVTTGSAGDRDSSTPVNGSDVGVDVSGAVQGMPQAAQAPDAPIAVTQRHELSGDARVLVPIVEALEVRQASFRSGHTSSSFRVVLHPATLGVVVVDVEHGRNGLHVTLTPEHTQTQALLEGHMPDLLSTLRSGALGPVETSVLPAATSHNHGAGAAQPATPPSGQVPHSASADTGAGQTFGGGQQSREWAPPGGRDVADRGTHVTALPREAQRAPVPAPRSRSQARIDIHV